MLHKSVKISWRLTETSKTQSVDSTWQGSTTWIKTPRRRKRSEIICLNPASIIKRFSHLKTLKFERWCKWRHSEIRLQKYRSLTPSNKGSSWRMNLVHWLLTNTSQLILIWPRSKIMRKRRRQSRATMYWGLTPSSATTITFKVKKMKAKSLKIWSLKRIVVWSSKATLTKTSSSTSQNRASMSILMC